MKVSRGFQVAIVVGIYVASVASMIFVLRGMGPDQVNGFFVAVGFVIFWGIFMLAALLALVEFSPQITLNKNPDEGWKLHSAPKTPERK